MRGVEIRRVLKIAAVLEKFGDNRRRWNIHIEHRPSNRLPVGTLKYKSKGQRDVGGPMRWVPEQFNQA